MKNLILAAVLALAGVSSVNAPAQAASAIVITQDGVTIRPVDRDRHHHYRDEVRRDRREFRHEVRRERREFRHEMRREHCRSSRVTHWRHHRLVTETVRICS